MEIEQVINNANVNDYDISKIVVCEQVYIKDKNIKLKILNKNIYIESSYLRILSSTKNENNDFIIELELDKNFEKLFSKIDIHIIALLKNVIDELSLNNLNYIPLLEYTGINNTVPTIRILFKSTTFGLCTSSVLNTNDVLRFLMEINCVAIYTDDECSWIKTNIHSVELIKYSPLCIKTSCTSTIIEHTNVKKVDVVSNELDTNVNVVEEETVSTNELDIVQKDANIVNTVLDTVQEEVTIVNTVLDTTTILNETEEVKNVLNELDTIVTMTEEAPVPTDELDTVQKEANIDTTELDTITILNEVEEAKNVLNEFDKTMTEEETVTTNELDTITILKEVTNDILVKEEPKQNLIVEQHPPKIVRRGRPKKN